MKTLLMAGMAVSIVALTPRCWAAEADAGEYLIEPPDVLEVQAAGIGLRPVSELCRVQPDGTIVLKDYGVIPVAGLSVSQAREVLVTSLEQHTRRKRQNSIVVLLNIAARNSKVYYVIAPRRTGEQGEDGESVATGEGVSSGERVTGREHGEQVLVHPWSADETVVHAILKVEGLAPVAMEQGVTIVRPPADGGLAPPQVLDVDWKAITQDGRLARNHTLHAGDRLYVGKSR